MIAVVYAITIIKYYISEIDFNNLNLLRNYVIMFNKKKLK